MSNGKRNSEEGKAKQINKTAFTAVTKSKQMSSDSKKHKHVTKTPDILVKPCNQPKVPKLLGY